MIMTSQETDTCVILGVLIEQEQWSRSFGRTYYGNVNTVGGGLSYFDNEWKTSLHKKVLKIVFILKLMILN